MRFVQCLFVISGVTILLLGLGCARRHSAVNPIFTEDVFSGNRSGMAWNDKPGTRDAGASTGMEGLGIQRTRAPYDPVYFAFDSYALSDETLSALRGYAPHMQSNPMPLMIEGHCDERGTEEYNLALGEHRAIAVKDHLVRLGIDGQNLTTISYGEELPADPGHGETAWAKNRRVEFSER